MRCEAELLVERARSIQVLDSGLTEGAGFMVFGRVRESERERSCRYLRMPRARWLLWRGCSWLGSYRIRGIVGVRVPPWHAYVRHLPDRRRCRLPNLANARTRGKPQVHYVGPRGEIGRFDFPATQVAQVQIPASTRKPLARPRMQSGCGSHGECVPGGQVSEATGVSQVPERDPANFSAFRVGTATLRNPSSRGLRAPSPRSRCTARSGR